MMKYTARSMLAIGAVAVMQGESVTQTDALQIKPARKGQGNRAFEAALVKDGRFSGSTRGLSEEEKTARLLAVALAAGNVEAKSGASRGITKPVHGSPIRQTKLAYGSCESENKSPNAFGQAPNQEDNYNKVKRTIKLPESGEADGDEDAEIDGIFPRRTFLQRRAERIGVFPRLAISNPDAEREFTQAAAAAAQE